jgi:protein involved in polysaccharide export with SLBB domain
VKIQGAINNPDALLGVQVPYIKEMTIQDLIVKVGGLTEAASLSKIEIVRRKRNVDAKQIDAQISDIIEFEIRSDLNFDSKSESVKLLPYDEVFVRTSPNYEKQNFATTKGEVIYPGIYGIKYKDEKISDLISRAGGLSPQAYIKGATMVRKTLLSDFQKTQREEVLNNLNINVKVKAVTKSLDEEEPEFTEEGEILNNLITESVGIDLEKILKNPGSVEDLILQDGDEINIPKKLQTVRIEGEVLYPTTVKYHPDLNFIDYISKSGGFTKKSSRGKAFIIYPNGSVDRTRKFVFIKIHPKIEPGSEIIIPGKTENTQAQLAQFGGIIGTLGGTLTAIVSIFGLLKLNQN